MFLRGTIDNAKCTRVGRVALRRDPKWRECGRDGVYGRDGACGRDGARPSRFGRDGRVALRRDRRGRRWNAVPTGVTI